MPETCLLCLSNDFAYVSERDRNGKPLRTALCKGCGIVCNDPIPSDDELAAFYRHDYRLEYKKAYRPRMRQVWRNFKRTSRHFRIHADFYADRTKCLDLGSGSGEFMYLARKLGIDCIGVEPNEGYATYSRDELGLNVVAKTLEETEFAAGSFDLIRLSHVMEHMRDPVRSLRALSRLLREDGLIYVEVPNIERGATRKVRGSLFHFGHIYNFTPTTMRAAAALAGLEEHPASFKKLGHQTSGFFRKSQAHVAPDTNIAHAQRMRAVFAAHRSSYLPKAGFATAVQRMAIHLSQRVNDILNGARFGSPSRIGDHFAKQVTLARTAPAPKAGALARRVPTVGVIATYLPAEMNTALLCLAC